MLTPEEIKQIGAEMAKVIEDNVNPQFEGIKKQIGLEMCQVIEDNVNPQFESINKHFEGVNQQFEIIHKDIQEIRDTMVTKEYLVRN